MQGYEYFITIHFISLSIPRLPKCCLFIYCLAVHQEYLILNIRYGWNHQPQPWRLELALESNDRCLGLGFGFPVYMLFPHADPSCEVTSLTEVLASCIIIALICRPHKLTPPPKRFSCEPQPRI